MKIQAQLTNSHKVSQNKNVFDSVIEKQNKLDKEPTSQFFGITYKNDLKNQYNQSEIKSLVRDSNNILIPTTGDIDYPNSFDGKHMQYFVNCIDAYKINMQGSIEIFNIVSLSIAQAGFFTTPYTSDYSIPMYYILNRIENNQLVSILELECGNLNYSSSQDSFSFETIGEITQVINTRALENITNGTAKILSYIGFISSDISSPVKQHLRQADVYPIMINEILYKGKTK